MKGVRFVCGFHLLGSFICLFAIIVGFNSEDVFFAQMRALISSSLLFTAFSMIGIIGLMVSSIFSAVLMFTGFRKPHGVITQSIVGELESRRPPLFAEYLLYFLPKSQRDPLLGDLEEEYHMIYHRFGERRAVVWYWGQVAMSFWPLIRAAVRKLIAWGIVKWAGDLLRRFIS